MLRKRGGLRVMRRIFQATLPNGLVGVPQQFVKLCGLPTVTAFCGAQIFTVDGKSFVGLCGQIVPRDDSDVALMMLIVSSISSTTTTDSVQIFATTRNRTFLL